MLVIPRIILTALVLMLTCTMLFGCGGINIHAQMMGSISTNSALPNLVDKPSSPIQLADTERKVELQKETGIVLDKDPLISATPWGKAGWANTWGNATEEDSQEYAYAVALGNNGNVYVTGNFAGTVDFSAGQNPQGYNIGSRGETDGYISCFNASGEFQWASWIGGDGSDGGRGLATDSEGCVYVIGYFEGEFDFDPHISRLDIHSSNGGSDIFLSKYDFLGRRIWTRTWGGLYYSDQGIGVAVDSQDNVFATGYFGKTVDFDPLGGVDQHTAKGGTDVFLTKLNSNGFHQWTRTLGGSKSDIGYGVAVDDAGNAYVTGFFLGTNVDFSAGQGSSAWKRDSKGGRDAFLCKFNSNGDFSWVNAWGSTGEDYGVGVATCPATDCVYATGFFEGVINFPVRVVKGRGGTSWGSKGERDSFLIKFSESGGFRWARTCGGPEWDQSLAVAVDNSGNVYNAGYYSETVDFDTKVGHDYHTVVGFHDCFLSKHNKDGDYQWTHTWGGGNIDECFGLAADPIGGAYVAGRFGGSINFASSGVDFHTAQGSWDIFLSSFPPDGKWGKKLRIPMKLEFKK